MLGINLMRLARPLFSFAPVVTKSRIPFPPQPQRLHYSSLPKRKWDIGEDVYKLSKYIDKTLLLKKRVDSTINEAYVKACEMGAETLVARLLDHNGLHLPEVQLGQIPPFHLNRIVKMQLQCQVKKLTLDDFEWALVHKNQSFFAFLLGHLTTDTKSAQLPNIQEDNWGLTGQASFETIVDHPRLKPYRALARTYRDHYYGNLLNECLTEMQEIQQFVNNALKTELSIEELCERKDFGPSVSSHVQKHLILLNTLHKTKDYSSLHWLSKYGMWRSLSITELL